MCFAIFNTKSQSFYLISLDLKTIVLYNHLGRCEKQSVTYRLPYRKETMRMLLEQVYLLFIYILFIYLILVTVVAVALFITIFVIVRKSDNKNTSLLDR